MPFRPGNLAARKGLLRMKLCMMSCCMSGTPQEVADAAVRCGMTGIDWVHTADLPTKDLRKISADAGLEVVSFTTLDERVTHLRADRHAACREILDLAFASGAGEVMLPPFAADGAAGKEEALARWIEFYAQAAGLAAEAGITITFETSPALACPVFLPEDALRVLDAVPGIRMVFDQGNMAIAADPIAAFDRLKDRVIRFHLKDFVLSPEPREGYTSRHGKHYRFELIGRGSLDIAGFWRHVPGPWRDLYATPETNDPTGAIPAPEAIRRVSRDLVQW
jgi:sugar phosphate isomerase/epimerase